MEGIIKQGYDEQKFMTRIASKRESSLLFVFGDKGHMHPLISGAHLYNSNLVLPGAAMLQCQEVEHSGCQTSDNIVQYDFQKIRFHFC